MRRIGIIGGGAWGTALAVTLARAGRGPTIWAHEPEAVEAMRKERRNPAFLPGIALPDAIAPTGEIGEACEGELVLLAVPAQHLRAICRRAAPHWRAGTPAVICAKGIETGTGALMTEVAAAELPMAPCAILSGPTFAIEVARGLPTAVTLASADLGLARRLAEAIGAATFRPYAGDDPAGVAICGAVKNVLAIACGVVEGRKLGDNARAALITRGLAEMARLVAAKKGRAETCMGLAGLGDLVLTASSGQSRNYSLGLGLGQGKPLAGLLAGRHDVVEGVATAPAVLALAERVGAELPVCAAVARLLGGEALDGIVADLLARPFKSEVGARAETARRTEGERVP